MDEDVQARGTDFDVFVKEISIEYVRQRHDDSRKLNTADLGFDIFPDHIVQLLRENQLHLHYHFSLYAVTVSPRQHPFVPYD